MTVAERIQQAIDQMDCEKDDINKLVGLAYYMGREEATRYVSDQYRALISEQRGRADKCRYSKMAHRVIGSKEYIYCGDYRMDMTNSFGADITTV